MFLGKYIQQGRCHYLDREIRKAVKSRHSFTSQPGHFTFSEPQNPWIDVSKLHQIRWLTIFEALELQNVRSGT